MSIIQTQTLQDISKDLRPIALTANMMKMLESIIGEWLWGVVIPHIHANQYSAVKGSSTCHALVDMLHHWHIGVENCQTSRVLLLDYSKAFDLVEHSIIIAKLAAFGVPDILLRWVGSFLGDRRQRTHIGQEVSDWLHLNGSVPQGSGLGPFLYVVMINDLIASCLLLHKFMDDSTVTEAIDNPAESKMQDASDNVVKWTEETNTRINEAKTKEMIITFQKNPPPILPLNINVTVIERV